MNTWEQQIGEEKARAVQDLKVGDFVWWAYSQDHPIPKYWDCPGVVVTTDLTHLTIRTYDDDMAVTISRDNYRGRIVKTTIEQVIEWTELREQAINADLLALKHQMNRLNNKRTHLINLRGRLSNGEEIPSQSNKD